MIEDAPTLNATDIGSSGSLSAREPLALSRKKTARFAGAFYLLVGIFGGFAQGFVEPKLYAAGDATTTAMNVAGNPELVRLGVVADLANQVCFVFLALTLYGLLKYVHQGVALAMVVLVALAVGIGSLNTVFLFEGLQIVSEASYVTAWGTAGVNALVLLMLDLHHYGLLVSQVFFGLWLAPLGYLAYQSRQFPKPLAGTLVLATVCYLIDLLSAFLVPDLGRLIHGLVAIPCAVAEIWMVIYLLIIGVNTSRDARAIAVGGQ